MVEVFSQHQFLLKLPFRHFLPFRNVIIPQKTIGKKHRVLWLRIEGPSNWKWTIFWTKNSRSNFTPTFFVLWQKYKSWDKGTLYFSGSGVLTFVILLTRYISVGPDFWWSRVKCTETETLQGGRQAALQLYFGILSLLMKRLSIQLEQKMQILPKGNVLVIGDSIIRWLSCHVSHDSCHMSHVTWL